MCSCFFDTKIIFIFYSSPFSMIPLQYHYLLFAKYPLGAQTCISTPQSPRLMSSESVCGFRADPELTA